MGLPAFGHFTENELGRFPHFVLYAILECTLISLLLTEGIVAFVAFEFAKIFDLRTPCSLCTRIDHLLIHRNPDFYYNDAMCEDHKKDVSSLAYCHVHGKLSDIRSMCEGCLLSFNTEAKSSDHNSATSKNLECLFDDGLRARLKMPYWVKDDSDQKGNTEDGGYFCSCCGEPMKVKSSYGHKSGSNNANNRLTQAPTPSPRTFAPWRNEELRNLELSHVDFTDLKLSDSSPADEDDGNVTVAGKDDPKAAAVPLLTETDEVPVEDPYRSTPTYAKGASNKFFAIPLTDSATSSPRWASRVPRKSFFDRVELTQDPVEACCANDSDMDTILNRLKRQVRLDRKSLIALYMELDEERSASAIAANNAMAMITRLQAEKAAVQMEALQYQRMMDEQAQYDQEAVQAMREMLDKRDEEYQELVTEVELYRQRYGIPGLTGDIISDREQDDVFELKSCSGLSTERSDRGSPGLSVLDTDTHDLEHDQYHHGHTSSFDFEREGSYLLDQLRMLEPKVVHTPSTGVANLSNGIGTKLELESEISTSVDYKGIANDNLSSLKVEHETTHTSTTIGTDFSSDHKMVSEPHEASPTDHTALKHLANCVMETHESVQSHELPRETESESPHKTEPELPPTTEPELPLMSVSVTPDQPYASSAAENVTETTNSNRYEDDPRKS